MGTLNIIVRNDALYFIEKTTEIIPNIALFIVLRKRLSI